MPSCSASSPTVTGARRRGDGVQQPDAHRVCEAGEPGRIGGGLALRQGGRGRRRRSDDGQGELGDRAEVSTVADACVHRCAVDTFASSIRVDGTRGPMEGVMFQQHSGPEGELPVVVVGAGPIGLAAAAHCRRARLEPLVLEAGDRGRRRGARVGPRAPVLALVASSSTRPRARSSPRPAGRRRTRPRTPPGGSGPSCTCSRWRTPSATAVRYGTRVTGVARSAGTCSSATGASDEPFVVHVRDRRRQRGG